MLTAGKAGFKPAPTRAIIVIGYRLPSNPTTNRFNGVYLMADH